jgi:hypothetical protein
MIATIELGLQFREIKTEAIGKIVAVPAKHTRPWSRRSARVCSVMPHRRFATAAARGVGLQVPLARVARTRSGEQADVNQPPCGVHLEAVRGLGFAGMGAG